MKKPSPSPVGTVITLAGWYADHLIALQQTIT